MQSPSRASVIRLPEGLQITLVAMVSAGLDALYCLPLEILEILPICFTLVPFMNAGGCGLPEPLKIMNRTCDDDVAFICKFYSFPLCVKVHYDSSQHPWN